MRLPFINRVRELKRLAGFLRRRHALLACVYGRRRCGKSRLLNEALRNRAGVYYVADDREPALQRRSLAHEMASLVPGFDRVEYPGWDELLDRWQADAPRGAVLVVDELPALVASSPELPSLLQKRLDRPGAAAPKLILCGSSQRMMHGPSHLLSTLRRHSSSHSPRARAFLPGSTQDSLPAGGLLYRAGLGTR